MKYMINGDGLRVVLWLSDLKSYVNDFLFDDSVRKELFSLLKNDLCSGLTLVGGEPFSLENSNYVAELFLEVKEKFPSKTIWCYTKYNWEELIKYYSINNKFSVILDSLDVLIGGDFSFNSSFVSNYVGGSSHCIIDVKKSLAKKQEIFYIFDYDHTLGTF